MFIGVKIANGYNVFDSVGSSIRLKILVGLLRWVNRFWKWRVRCVGMKDLRVS